MGILIGTFTSHFAGVLVKQPEFFGFMSRGTDGFINHPTYRWLKVGEPFPKTGPSFGESESVNQWSRFAMNVPFWGFKYHLKGPLK